MLYAFVMLECVRLVFPVERVTAHVVALVACLGVVGRCGYHCLGGYQIREEKKSRFPAGNRLFKLITV